MSAIDLTEDDGEASWWPGWRAMAVAAGLYLAVVVVATDPVARHFRSRMAASDWTDPLQHLAVMRWYKACLLGGRWPLRVPELQYPVGAPLGNFSPLHLQATLFVPLSLALGDDVLCYNIIWVLGFLFMGLGTYLLAWHVLRDRPCAWFAGLLAMLSTPMMMHARSGPLELIHVGAFPAFLVGWLRFVDRPSRGRLAAAAGLYVLLAMSAAYFAVFAVFPAALYVVGRAARAGRRGARAWLRDRAAWFVAFAGLTAPALALLFSASLWSMARGDALPRTRAEFAAFGAPLWSYVAPTAAHRFGALLPRDPYDAAGHGWKVRLKASYLGVVPLGLLAYAAIARVRFRRASYWWAALLLLVVLSMGASCQVGSYTMSLPADWARRGFFAFRLIRVPARFNKFAAVVAAVVASAGLRHGLDHLRRYRVRVAVFAALVAVAVADLSTAPFAPLKLPAMPAGYAVAMATAPGAAILEAPQDFTGRGTALGSICTYWQSRHGGRTSAGYSGQANVRYDEGLAEPSPFLARRLADPGYLAHPDAESFDLVGPVIDARDYAWLYLQTHGFRFVLLHEWPYAALHAWPGAVPEEPVRLDRLKALLREGLIFDDGATAVYDRDRLAPPRRPVLLCADGWRRRAPWRGRPACVVGPVARLSLFNPDPCRPLRLALDAEAFREPRTVRLLAGPVELARWEVRPGGFATYATPPLRLTAGRLDLTLASDGQAAPRRRREAASEADRRPYSLRVAAVRLAPEPADATGGPREAEGDRGTIR